MAAALRPRILRVVRWVGGQHQHEYQQVMQYFSYLPVKKALPGVGSYLPLPLLPRPLG